MSIGLKKIFVIGHKNPDTDSICSAIAYAYLKNKVADGTYIPKRAGQLNEETLYVLNKFGISTPEYVSDVRTQVMDIQIREVEGVDSSISLKKAWSLMKEQDDVTLPITESGQLEGLITIGDIAESYMEVYDSRNLAKANTSYSNIVETLDGSIIVGSMDEYFADGKVLIAAANPDLMENYIEEGDLVILGNRYESQFSAIEMKAGCIVVCEGVEVSLTIQKLASERGCTVIRTPHDTYTVARLINQSMPIGYFMSKENLITFKTDAFTEEMKDVMAKKRHRYFPILDKKGRYIGMISRRNLLNAERKKIILVDHNEKGQAVDGIQDAEILEIIDHHRLGTIETITPVFFRNQPLGCTATIIYQMFREKAVEIPRDIAGLLCAAIVSDTLMYRSPTCTEVDKQAAEHLASIAGIEVNGFAQEMFGAGSNLKTKSAEEIFYQDFKKFIIDGVRFGIGQINSMNKAELTEIKDRLVSYLHKASQEIGLDMLYFMLTDIIEESTELICIGSESADYVRSAFGSKEEGDTFILKGVVSRKKQLLPAIMMAIQQ